MSDRLDKIETKIDKFGEHLSNIDKTLERNTVSLEEHMRRSDAIEAYVKRIEEEDLKPVKKHVNNITAAVKGILWFCGVAAGVATFLHKFGII